jgi:RNA polymerase sigma-70 factor, ECF subfamily
MKEWAARVAGWIARGRAAFPGVAVDDAVVTAWLAARGADRDDLPAEDVYLACACAAGRDPDAAIEVFAARHLPRLVPALRHAGLDDAAIAEVEQELVALLFVGDGAPHVATYAAKSDLHAWVKAIAVRLALRRRERDARHAGDDALVGLAADADPRMEHLRRTAGVELRAAFATALAGLSAADRTLLRQHHLDGVSLDALAAAHRCHRATIARRLAAARQAVADATRADLLARVRVDPADLESLIRLVRSQLDASLRVHLAP